MIIGFSVLRFLHILGVVFMAWPLYALISVNERGRLGAPLGSDADTYMENIIKGQARRCYIFQLTVGATGLGLLMINGMGLTAILSNWVLTSKTILLIGVISLLSYVHLSLQPRIDTLFSGLDSSGQNIPDETRSKISSLRVRRKRLAGLCLFLVITLIILGVQVFEPFNPLLTLVLFVLAAIFAWRAYRGPIKYGWI
ncbi:hypothetical protein E3J38_03775 [candidate division TA06 bacterium]|uniref:DUF2269 family protein n=1 Tax=candidate division TA06 bacterium TaxID=2250710 RepID=A0A523XQD3_UNCT6|nr:MAG: hypothetical protein E3J38_03775 [candidate division TA06 bacterium]